MSLCIRSDVYRGERGTMGTFGPRSRRGQPNFQHNVGAIHWTRRTTVLRSGRRGLLYIEICLQRLGHVSFGFESEKCMGISEAECFGQCTGGSRLYTVALILASPKLTCYLPR